MADAHLLTGSRLRAARTVSVGMLTLVAVGTTLALAAYPSWQLALAVVCVFPCP